MSPEVPLFDTEPSLQFSDLRRGRRRNLLLEETWKALKYHVTHHVTHVTRDDLKRLSSGSPIPLEHRYLTLGNSTGGGVFRTGMLPTGSVRSGNDPLPHTLPSGE